MSTETHTWPELAHSLYEHLTGSNAEISYHFDNLEVSVPSGTGDAAKHADWKLNGTLRIHTRNRDEG